MDKDANEYIDFEVSETCWWNAMMIVTPSEKAKKAGDIFTIRNRRFPAILVMFFRRQSMSDAIIFGQPVHKAKHVL